jgi:riboflavin biosynthesis pyrimidine reductase
VREIFPRPAQLGPAGPLPDRIGPAAAGLPGVSELVDELAARYAYPDRPWIRANMITSADGAVTVDGRSGGLSGVADRLVFSVLRSLADVVLVGAGTVRAEGYGRARPADLWPRLRAGRAAAPPIAVITRRLDLDLGGRLLGGHGDGGEGDRLARTIILTTRAAPADRLRAAAGVADVVVAGDESVSASAAIDALAGLGCRRILTEGGPALLGQLAAAGLLDELCLTISPVLEGGHSARIIAPPGPDASAGPAGLELAMVLEDRGYLLTRYLRAGTP